MAYKTYFAVVFIANCMMNLSTVEADGFRDAVKGITNILISLFGLGKPVCPTLAAPAPAPAPGKEAKRV